MMRHILLDKTLTVAEERPHETVGVTTRMRTDDKSVFAGRTHRVMVASARGVLHKEAAV